MGAYPVYVVDGDVKFGWVEEGFKDYLTLMHQWYTEGLLGADFYICLLYTSDAADDS